VIAEVGGRGLVEQDLGPRVGEVGGDDFGDRKAVRRVGVGAVEDARRRPRRR
jgi:hypothetical protein